MELKSLGERIKIWSPCGGDEILYQDVTEEVSADTIQTWQSQSMTLGLGKIMKCIGKPVSVGGCF